MFALAAGLLAGCAGGDSPDRASSPDARPDTVRPGAAVLLEGGLERLRGKRVGLIVNQTSRVDTTHVIDALAGAEDVEVGALFASEHGLEGRADAGEAIEDGRDTRTGAPVYSIYGDTRQPTPEMLEGLDVLVFDMQDVGARFYTYLTTMGLSMQAAAREDLPFVVLDRPNPIGGEKTAGFVLEPEHASFVGRYPIPVRHGLTPGELARMIKGEAWLEGLDSLRLDVVPAEGWRRGEHWPATNRPWVAPSPNIPDYTTALIYPGAAFFEATAASEGRGTDRPFTLVGAPWADGQVLADTLNARGLPGVRFEPAAFTPEPNEGDASPKLEGRRLEGVRHVITDPQAYRSVATGVHVLHAFYHRAPSKEDFLSRPEWLVRLSGTERMLEMLRAGRRPEAIVAAWREEVSAYRSAREKYLLYE